MAPAIVAINLKIRIEGWEIDSFASWLSSFFIEVAAAPISAKTGQLIEPSIRTLNSLCCNQKEFDRFDLTIGNPSFGCMCLDPAIKESYSRSLYGHANLYGIFTELAVRLTKPSGVIAYLTPASFLAGVYFKNLRSFLWQENLDTDIQGQEQLAHSDPSVTRKHYRRKGTVVQPAKGFFGDNAEGAG